VAGQAGAAEFADRIGGCLARLLAIEHLTVRERGGAYSGDNPHEKPFRHCRYPFSVHSRRITFPGPSDPVEQPVQHGEHCWGTPYYQDGDLSFCHCWCPHSDKSQTAKTNTAVSTADAHGIQVGWCFPAWKHC